MLLWSMYIYNILTLYWFTIFKTARSIDHRLMNELLLPRKACLQSTTVTIRHRTVHSLVWELRRG